MKLLNLQSFHFTSTRQVLLTAKLVFLWNMGGKNVAFTRCYFVEKLLEVFCKMNRIYILLLLFVSAVGQ